MSDIKCPYCNEELERDGDVLQCSDINCRHLHNLYGSYELWQELIRTRKALEIAVEALKDFSIHPDNSVKKYANKVLEQITAEQKGE